ncbi:hypothetical protein G3143_001328 [Salmonella enterica subsp. enterica serovar Javiana]|nr:hypothetical protein [Salmonella enterica subsp. enterica serovar Javiana]EEO7205520.1 hypothetical protein [Salmonella enterica subsp. enterica serovar Rubislaw]EEG7328418.1 hypothetical protein [Salmonella enterica subsp. enterica serovar Javiana]EEK7937011.1 hypothetical protein [Salmonella enterica subsp. enterica serovar Javiana]EEK8080711.1 hypothetical protein [Salmonella enterica subsp. enterica serovar Javiana]
MNNEIRFEPKDVDEELANRRMLERMRDIVALAIDKGLSVTEAQHIINREISLISDEVTLYNQKARDSFIRRRLGLDDSDVITFTHEVEAFV